jgi:hypothetical protein
VVSEPLAGGVHHLPDGDSRARQRLEHDEVPERRIVPVRPIALVDDGQDARDDRAVLACPERADRAAAGERGLALEDRQLQRQERGPAGTLLLVHGVVEEQELAQLLGSLRGTDLDRHRWLLSRAEVAP